MPSRVSRCCSCSTLIRGPLILAFAGVTLGCQVTVDILMTPSFQCCGGLNKKLDLLFRRHHSRVYAASRLTRPAVKRLASSQEQRHVKAPVVTTQLLNLFATADGGVRGSRPDCDLMTHRTKQTKKFVVPMSRFSVFVLPDSHVGFANESRTSNPESRFHSRMHRLRIGQFSGKTVVVLNHYVRSWVGYPARLSGCSRIVEHVVHLRYGVERPLSQ